MAVLYHLPNYVISSDIKWP